MDLLTPDTSIALLRASQGETLSAEQNVKSKKTAENLQEIEETAQDFEAVFLTEMMKPMFEGIETDGLFRGGKGEEVFRSFLLQEYGKIMSQSGGVGIADHVKEQMIRLQEQQVKPQEFAEINIEEGQTNDINQED